MLDVLYGGITAWILWCVFDLIVQNKRKRMQLLGVCVIDNIAFRILTHSAAEHFIIITQNSVSENSAYV